VVPLFQNVLVLAVGRDLGAQLSSDSRYRKEEAPAGGSPLITLALTPQEANLMAFITEQGKVRLVLRSPADSKIEPIQPAGWESLFQYLIPQLPGQAKEQAQEIMPEKEKPREVEIYRGLKRETIAVSKQQDTQQ